jgi:hypothetical protein
MSKRPVGEYIENYLVDIELKCIEKIYLFIVNKNLIEFVVLMIVVIWLLSGAPQESWNFMKSLWNFI